jgi:uncharacterized protein (TIGR02145 family)
MKLLSQFSMKAFPLIFLCFIFIVVLSSNGKCQGDSVSDREGNSYRTVTIGEQSWMAENLRVTQYTNGDEIPHVTNDTLWTNTREGAYCYYENNAENTAVYGNLYNWYTINDARGVCPAGWRVPADRDWLTLEKYLGMTASEAGRMTAWRGTDEGDKLKLPGFGGNNSSGFSAIGSGYRDPQGIFKAQGTDNDYWTSTAFSTNTGVEGILHGLLNSKSTVVRNHHFPGYGFCVRCVMDKIAAGSKLPVSESRVSYPNPSEGLLYVQNADGDELAILDIRGITLMTGSITESVQQVDISGLEPGTYILRITGSEGPYNEKIIRE